MKILIPFVCAVSIATLAGAQTRGPAADPDPTVSLRPFAVFSAEAFSAHDTFKSIFGRSVEPMWGGGLELGLRDIYVDVTATRFQKTGQRAFFFNGQSFQLGIPVPVTLTPLEVTAGYRFKRRSRLTPYAGAGVGLYSYTEKGDATDGSEDFSAHHAGFVITGGAEFRVKSWIGVSGDVQYTRVPGILGSGGLSQDTNENDLGGVAFRVRALFGR